VRFVFTHHHLTFFGDKAMQSQALARTVVWGGHGPPWLIKPPLPCEGRGLGCGVAKTTRQLSKVLRKRPTDAERLLWRHLRNRERGGCKFKRQYPVGPYIVDFICLEKNLVIEVDGGQHAENEEMDIQRSEYLNKMGYRVLRFWNNQVLVETEAVLNSIFAKIAEPN
jgi:very-short-patch-repair endonuclease